jgi:hypothetical protein
MDRRIISLRKFQRQHVHYLYRLLLDSLASENICTHFSRLTINNMDQLNTPSEIQMMTHTLPRQLPFSNPASEKRLHIPLPKPTITTTDQRITSSENPMTTRAFLILATVWQPSQQKRLHIPFPNRPSSKWIS